jgi:hypothetical protein
VVRKKMNTKTKASIAIVAILFLFLLSMESTVAGAASLTLPSTPQTPGGTVTISGIGFGASKPVGIGFGSEVALDNETFLHPGAGFGPFSITLAKAPIKPGTFVLSIAINNGLITNIITDNGLGALTSTATSGFVSGTIDYVTGKVTYNTNTDAAAYTITRNAAYTSYQYNVTPTSGVNTTATGSFNTNITVPNVGSENYYISAIDTAGNIAVQSLTIVPENLTIGVIVVLSSIAVVASSRYLRSPKVVTEIAIN